MDTKCMKEITARYTCRHFRDVDIARQKVESVLEAGRLAPSGFGLEPWRFLVADKPADRGRIANACFNQTPAATAPVLVMIVAKVGALNPDSEYVRRQLTVEAAGGDPSALLEDYRLFCEAADVASWAVGQCQIAAAFMMLEAVHQGLASCPMGGFAEGELRRAISLPAGETPALVLALGECADKQGPRIRRSTEEVIRYL
jgi:nitroreductase